MENKGKQSDDDQYDEQDDNLQPQQNLSNDYEQKPQQELENAIMEQVLKKEKKEGSVDTISEQLQEKLQSLLSRIPGKNQQQILNIRMHELAICKILVFTHGKSQFRLVQAHYHIGEAYLNYKCYQQAIDHLTVALKKNTKLNDIKQTKLYHSYMLTTYSRCYYEISSYEDALEVLNRAYDIQQGFKNTQSQINNIQTLLLTSNCHLKLKDYKNAIQFILKAIQIISEMKGQNSKDYALAKVELGKIYAAEGNIQKAIEQISKSIKMLEDINYGKKEQIGELHQTLADYYQKFGDFQSQINQLKQKYNVYEELYGYMDKRCLKIKRTYAMTLLKHQKSIDSLNQLQDILEIQQKVFGENSPQVGKTLKIIGTIHINNNNPNQAQNYLKKAHKILHDQGHAKLVKEIKAKLTYLRQIKNNPTINEQMLKA